MTTDQLRQEAVERAKKVGISPDLMAEALRKERRDRPYVVEFEDKPAMAFYRVTQEGPSKVLYINIHHPFFLNCYMAPGSTVRYRDVLEVFLWVLGTSELEAEGSDAVMYLQERQEWSNRLGYALDELATIMDFEGMRDAQALAEMEAETDEDEDDPA